MSRLMTIDPHFGPRPLNEGDEAFPNGIFVFNITAMLAFLREHPDAIPLVEAEVKEYCREDFRLEPAEIDSFDLSRPVLLAEIAPDRYNLIDGHHRMEKARRLGLITLPAYKIPSEVHVHFLTSEKGYMAYIEYWNMKLREE